MAQTKTVRTVAAQETDKGDYGKTNDNSILAEGSTPIHDALPPGTANKGDISFEELGKLSEFPDPALLDNPADGTGEYVVVLADILSGAGEDSFKKGQVRRLSRIVPGFDDKTVSREVIKGRIKRLFEAKGIRKATRDEQGQDWVEVTMETESEAVQAERNRRIASEEENARLRAALANAQAGQAAATPGVAGASEQAQAEAAAEGKEGTEPNDWEED